MCVIAYFPKNSKEPKKEDLKAMWDRNPDGGGMMWIEKDGVHYSKGYFDFNEFYKDFLIIKRDYDFECAVHFRIATSGGINQEMCHPFPLTNEKSKLKALWGKTNCAVMHNGILPIDTPHKDLNDTCEFIINKMYPFYHKDHRFFLNLPKAKQNVFETTDLANNKLLLFDKNGVKTFGHWQKYKDYFVSNLYWSYYKPVRKSYSYNYNNYNNNNYNYDYDNTYYADNDNTYWDYLYRSAKDTEY